MDSVSKTEYHFDLQFLAVSKAEKPGLPRFIWNSYVLNNFAASPSQTVEFTCSFAEALHQVYPELSTIELASVYELAANTMKLGQMALDDLLSTYKVKPTSQNKRILSRLPSLPKSFKSWCQQKGLQPHDLVSLLSANDPSLIEESLNSISAFYPSKSNGVGALELIVELQLMNRDTQPKPQEDFLSWLKRLKAMRYPLRSSKTEKSKSAISKLPWPPRMKAQWKSSGDHDSLQVQLEARSLVELEKKISQLTKIAERMKDNDPWMSK